MHEITNADVEAELERLREIVKTEPDAAPLLDKLPNPENYPDDESTAAHDS